jgi:hypothetical protein
MSSGILANACLLRIRRRDRPCHAEYNAGQGGTMNPTEQHSHATAVGKLHRRIDTLAKCVDEEVAERLQEIRVLVARLIAAEHAEHVLADQKNQLIHLGARRGIRQNTKSIVLLNFHLSQFVKMSFWERVRWNVFGTLPPPLAGYTEDPEASLFSELVSEPLSELSETSSENL